QGLDEAVMSIGGTSAKDVWAVGADKGNGSLVLHFDGSVWSRVNAQHTGHLWWVHALSKNAVFMAGANGTVLHYNGQTFASLPTPGLGRDTVYGIWGNSENDLYAVGSFAGRN